MAAEDIRVWIPRVRRAVEGVGATSLLTDDQVKDLIADAISNVILFTGGVFGKDLLVTGRDPVTDAPAEYATSEPLTLSEGSVVAYEAAINHTFFALRDVKVAETIKDEGQEWTYALSSALMRDHLKWLMTQRDRALEDVQAPIPVAFVSFLHERDALSARIVEPYVLGYGSGGQELTP